MRFRNGEDRAFTYQPRASIVVIAILFFGVCGGVLRGKALSNDRALLINGLIELSREDATRFYWVLAGLSVVMVAAAIFAGLSRLSGPRSLVLAADGLWVPGRFWSRQSHFVGYRQIRSIAVHTMNRQRYLKVVHDQGKLNIMASMHASEGDFDVFCSLLEQRLQLPAQLPEASRYQAPMPS